MAQNNTAENLKIGWSIEVSFGADGPHATTPWTCDRIVGKKGAVWAQDSTYATYTFVLPQGTLTLTPVAKVDNMGKIRFAVELVLTPEAAALLTIDLLLTVMDRDGDTSTLRLSADWSSADLPNNAKPNATKPTHPNLRTDSNKRHHMNSQQFMHKVQSDSCYADTLNSMVEEYTAGIQNDRLDVLEACCDNANDLHAEFNKYVNEHLPVNGNLRIYISKASGNDKNEGLTPETAVQTIDRALDVAHKKFQYGSNTYVDFDMDKGPWGSYNFNAVPFVLHIAPFDNISVTKYNENLPHFDEIIINCSKVYLDSIQVKTINANTGASLVIQEYIRLAQCETQFNSITNVRKNTIIDIIDLGTTGFIFASNVNSHLFLSGTTLTFINQPTQTEFCRITDCSSFQSASANIPTINVGKFTVPATKFSIDGSSVIWTESALGDLTDINKFPGTANKIATGAIVNSIPYVSNDFVTTFNTALA